MMSLYDGLESTEGGGDTKTDVASGWSSNYKLLQSQLQAKKATLLQSKKNKQNITLAPVVDLKRHDDEESPLHFNQQTGRLERMPVPPPSTPSQYLPAEPIPSLTGVDDEYNPFRPNDYEEFVKKKRDLRQKERDDDTSRRDEFRDRPPRDQRRDFGEEDEYNTNDRGRHNKRGDFRRRRDRPGGDRHHDYGNRDGARDGGGGGEMERAARRHRDEEEDYDKPKRMGSGAAIAPPQSLIENIVRPDEDPGPSTDDLSSAAAASMGLVGSVASKIMAKYGYRHGQGLGKKEQGMSTALQVEKTSKRGGKIIHEKDLPKELPKDPATNANLLKNPSKVILLRNMVGPGEVDEELEPETADECSKYGKVIKCLIFEIPGTPDDEAVRIFLEFERLESAIKAVVDLNGRFFGGRTVKANFYNLDRFRRLDLALEVE